jgi:mannose/fructose-specific phosphotransferase system component IIA
MYVLRISGSRWRGASAVVRINSLLIAGVNISLMIVSIDISITGNGTDQRTEESAGLAGVLQF